VIWRTFAISIVLGIAIDIALVWLFYWANSEPFNWNGFWIWQGVLIAASILLWARRLLGFVIWYAVIGRQAIISETFQQYLEHEFGYFDKQGDNVEGWLSEHVQQGQSSIAHELIAGLTVTRQAGIWQHFMTRAAYREAALKYSNYLIRRGYK
jgi:hypothetical protein